MSDPMTRDSFSLREIAIPAFGPSLLYGIADGAVLPVLAYSARDLGASVAVAGFIVALVGIGSLINNVPAALITARFGERRAMLGAGMVAIVAYVLCIAARQVWLLAVAALVAGMAGAIFSLARQLWLVAAVPFAKRARALSTLGGCVRIGVFIGPFAGALLIHWLGLAGAYGVAIAAMIGLILLVGRLPDLPAVETPPEATTPGRQESGQEETGKQGTTKQVARKQDGAAAPLGFRDILRSHARVFATLGIAVMLVGAIRASRQAAVPLWADALGLAPSLASIIYGVSALVDMTVFYPAGRVMDLYGRVWVAVPCTVLIGLSLIAIPFTSDFTSLLIVAMVLGFGNGIGSGIVMTLGADFAPPDIRTRFMGIWRMMVDLGSSGGPLLLSTLAALVSLAAGIWAIGALGLMAAVVFWSTLPRPGAR